MLISVAYRHRRAAAMTVLIEPFASAYYDRSRLGVIFARGSGRTLEPQRSRPSLPHRMHCRKAPCRSPQSIARLLAERCSGYATHDSKRVKWYGSRP